MIGREKELQQPYYTTVFEKNLLMIPFQNMNIIYFYDFRYSNWNLGTIVREFHLFTYFSNKVAIYLFEI